MDDMAAYYPPPPGTLPAYAYYQAPPPPQPPAAAAAPPPQPYLPHLHQAPFPSYGAPVGSHGSYDEVRTLFVAGLPEDVKAREIYNLFREFPGYESSHLRSPSKNSQPFAFAVFSDQQSAVAAMHALNIGAFEPIYDASSLNLSQCCYACTSVVLRENMILVNEGMVFDLEKGSTLYIDLAKSNSRSKRSRDEDRHGSDKRAKLSSPFSFGALDSGVGSTHMPGISNSAYSTIGYPSAQSGKVEGFVEAITACPVPFNYGSSDGRGIRGTTAAKTGNSSSPPCPTLFVANLGPRCTEQELIQVFSQCSGFLKLKMQSTYGAPVAFVDFQDTASSTEALNQLQGTLLHSSPAGDGIRLEYAKSRMGMRRKGK